MQALDIPKILKRLRSMNATQLRSGWYINEIPKKCRDIYEAFGIQLPVKENRGSLPMKWF